MPSSDNGFSYSMCALLDSNIVIHVRYPDEIDNGCFAGRAVIQAFISRSSIHQNGPELTGGATAREYRPR